MRWAGIGSGFRALLGSQQGGFERTAFSAWGNGLVYYPDDDALKSIPATLRAPGRAVEHVTSCHGFQATGVFDEEAEEHGRSALFLPSSSARHGLHHRMSKSSSIAGGLRLQSVSTTSTLTWVYWLTSYKRYVAQLPPLSATMRDSGHGLLTSLPMYH